MYDFLWKNVKICTLNKAREIRLREKRLKKSQSRLVIESYAGLRNFWELEIKGGVKWLKFHCVESVHAS